MISHLLHISGPPLKISSFRREFQNKYRKRKDRLPFSVFVFLLRLFVVYCHVLSENRNLCRNKVEHTADDEGNT